VYPRKDRLSYSPLPLLRTPSTGGSCNAWTMCHGTVTSRNINRVRCTRFPSWRPSTVHHSQDIHFFFLGHLPMFRTHVLPRSIIIVIISITSPTVHPQLRVCLAAKPLSVMHSAFPSNVDQPSRGATSSELVWIPAHSRNLNCRRRIDWLNGNPKFSQRILSVRRVLFCAFSRSLSFKEASSRHADWPSLLDWTSCAQLMLASGHISCKRLSPSRRAISPRLIRGYP